MTQLIMMFIHFTDGSKIVFRYPNITEASTLATKVKKALEQDKIVVQTNDSLMIVPVMSVKYIQVTPKPEALPEGIIRDAEIID